MDNNGNTRRERRHKTGSELDIIKEHRLKSWTLLFDTFVS